MRCTLLSIAFGDACARSSKSKEDRERAVDCDEGFLLESANRLANPAAGDRLYFVHHDLRGLAQTVSIARRHLYAKQRRISQLSRNRKNADRWMNVEEIRLNDERWTRFPIIAR
jgi:hypothetical protein